ncbi:MAG: hypothetical protein KAI98_01135 [Gemmatimonadetes bacterium]|nr:hypothetical protein [Gemmatimonadota bacterium]MCK5488556.1 hypothetical protein [Gemmatimonadota bacterium]
MWIGLMALGTPEEANAQRRPRAGGGWSDAGQIYWGGSINVRYGRTSGIGLYPLIGYLITPQWSAGARVGYEFWWRERFSETLTSHAVSGGLFTRYRLIPQIYAHLEGGGGNYDRVLFTGESDRVSYPFLFVGGGFSQSTGRRSWLLLEILYEVIRDVNSPYDGGGPVISIGVGVGF